MNRKSQIYTFCGAVCVLVFYRAVKSGGDSGTHDSGAGASAAPMGVAGSGAKQAASANASSSAPAKDKFSPESIARAQAGIYAGKLTSLEWEALYAEWARKDWKSAVMSLDGGGADLSAIRGILSGASLDDFASLLAFAAANMNNRSLMDLGCAAITMYQERQGLDVLGLVLAMPKEFQPDLLSSRLEAALTVNCSRPLTGESLVTLLNAPGPWAQTLAATLVQDALDNQRLSRELLLKSLTSSNAVTAEGLNDIVKAYSRRNPQDAVSLVLELPASAPKNGAAYTAFSRWAQQEPAAAGAWLNQLPRDELRDFFAAGYVSATKKIDPESSGVWQASITNPEAKKLSTGVLNVR